MPAISKALPRAAVTLPPVDDWRTTDQDEINRRRLRAREEAPQIVNRDAALPGLLEFRRPFAQRREIFRRNPRHPPPAVFLRMRGFPRQRPRHLQARRGGPGSPGNRLPGRLARRVGDKARRASTSRPTATRKPCASSAAWNGCRARCGGSSTRKAGSPAASCPRWCWNYGGRPRRPSRNCACRRKSSNGWNAAAARPKPSPCAAPTSTTSSPASGPRRKRSSRFSPTSARGCCTSPAPSARCWPTRWASAKPSRPWPPARCCAGSDGSSAC